jgi:hypothetical protein
MQRFGVLFAVVGAVMAISSLQAQPKIDLIGLDPQPSLSGACHPTKAHFTGRIRTTGPMEVTYQWLRSDGAHTEHTLNFSKAQTHGVTTDWSLSKNYSGWMQLVIVSPKRMQTTKANFKVQCGN